MLRARTDQFTILISSAGRRVALIENFSEAARKLAIDLRVITADAKPQRSAACQLADGAFAVPRCTEAEFLPAMLKLCEREGVSLLVPTIDTELAVLAENRARFAEIGTTVVISDVDVIAMARDKCRTAEEFQRAGVNVPRTARLIDLFGIPGGWEWPVILKPVGGSSSAEVRTAASIDEARSIGSARDDYIAQEQWFGREFTVNMFFDSAGQLRCAIPHERIETRGGEVSKARTERVPVLVEAAKKIAQALPGARGPLCFQAIVNDRGEAGVFELNARFGGGYPLAHYAGARFAQWLLEEAMGLPCSANDNWREGVTMLRYDAAVFVDR